METQLAGLTIPPRITKQSELFKVFNLPSNKASSKADGRAGGKGKNKKVDDEEEEDIVEDYNEEEDEQAEEEESDHESVGVDKESRHERALRRAREQEVLTTRRTKLKAEAMEGHGILHHSTKLSNFVPTRLYEAWTRKSLITTDAPARSFRGQNLVAHHTWEWGSSIGSSRARNMRIVVGSAIAEHSIILRYRRSLLSDVTGGACYLRNLMEEQSAQYRVVVRNSRQSRINNMKGQIRAPTKGPVALTWPDELVVPESENDTFNLTEELEKYHHDVLMAQQRAELQRTICNIELQRIAWQDTTNTATKGDRPAINPEVQECIVALAKVSSFNLS